MALFSLQTIGRDVEQRDYLLITVTSLNINTAIPRSATVLETSLNETASLAVVARMRDPRSLAEAHLRFLAEELANRGNSAIANIASAVCFTSIDQAFVLWGIASAIIFSMAQFSLLSWTTQAVLDAALTGVCIGFTSGLTWQIAKAENLRWVVFLWAVLMSGGMAVTAYGIFCGVGSILIALCPLWLGLCTLGYATMGIKMRSYSFTAAAIVHAIGTFAVDLVPTWQFLASGLVMTLTLFFFSVIPWDMRSVPPTGEPC